MMYYLRELVTLLLLGISNKRQLSNLLWIKDFLLLLKLKITMKCEMLIIKDQNLFVFNGLLYKRSSNFTNSLYTK